MINRVQQQEIEQIALQFEGQCHPSSLFPQESTFHQKLSRFAVTSQPLHLAHQHRQHSLLLKMLVQGWESVKCLYEKCWNSNGNCAGTYCKRNGGKEGVIIQEEAFLSPQVIFTELEKRGILVQEEVKELKSLGDIILA
ncbi:hypothetical protein H7K21_18860 [Cytobacillus firmus]|nr:hypothetical protein [Cytobacillus firmus]